MIDIHTHILPNIDDGARSIEETFNLIKEAKNVTFDYEFLHNPAKSEFSRFYCNKLCYWLSLMVSEKNIQQIKKDWPIYFTKAVTVEFIKNEQYKKVIDFFRVPTREALEVLENLQIYQNEIIKSVYGECPRKGRHPPP